MKSNLLLKWIVFLAVGLVATLASAEKDPVLKTQKDMESYAMGVEVAKNWKQQGLDFDPEVVFRGMRDALEVNKLLLSDYDLKATLNGIASQLRQKKAQARMTAMQDNKKKGEVFLAENKTKEGVVTLPSGLQYKVLKDGSGKKPTETDTIECRYRGTLIDGTEFENAGEKPGTFKVSEVIPGWREVLKLMSVGSKWQIFIPPHFAYGQQGSGRIGPNETLIFEMELVDIKGS